MDPILPPTHWPGEDRTSPAPTHHHIPLPLLPQTEPGFRRQPAGREGAEARRV